jgi:hypothetical protein
MNEIYSVFHVLSGAIASPLDLPIADQCAALAALVVEATAVGLLRRLRAPRRRDEWQSSEEYDEAA